MTIDDLGDPHDGVLHISVVFGFQDLTDIPAVLRRATTDPRAAGIDSDQVRYFVSRITLRRTDAPGLAGWRKRLFVLLAHRAAGHVEFLRLPAERTTVRSAEVPL
ncbi:MULTISPECIES: KUP/HAK/KT family potassium transporter [Micromonospora]|uniref:KUP/HAK/KT family potassium transporter n=1 Tax=Micromonospora TaxID=1873 RepID=UPI0019A278F8|nr:hypothetical protein [Micromonospora yangpuensis]GGM17765.1 hypothetical protein GCM10012279_39870 [Micromonospora yangpuensis]